MSEPIWIRKDVVIAIHLRQLSEHGGGAGIRDESLLDSALARPQNRHVYGDPSPSLAALAASYAFGIARNHPFVDGNKRTAFVTCLLFLRLNGKSVVADPEEKYRIFLQLAEGSLDEEALMHWISDHLRDP
ncbi:MAG: type II toxin-antitoxin system death-on-curing family toxin [Magnetococcales bacterium]|nr:type II toxin-antitoxin system death-on-curing family toxin [Magnetococcales bacterium]